MIDPSKISNYNQTQPQLEEALLFWVFAAGHNAEATAKGVSKFLEKINALVRPAPSEHPLFNIYFVAQVHEWSYVRELLGTVGLGCWRNKSRTVKELCLRGLNLHTCTVENLESIYGIGPKTARCFILHSRKGVRLAGLDTHILKFLRENGIKAPKTTPSTGNRYKSLEQEFLKLAEIANKEPSEFDLEIWNRYRKVKA